jgi:hypothetical protein
MSADVGVGVLGYEFLHKCSVFLSRKSVVRMKNMLGVN